MSENIVKWGDLTFQEQALLEMMNVALSPVSLKWDESNKKLLHLGVIAKVSRGIDTTFEAVITPAGRALLPAGEAVDEAEAHNNVLFGKYQAYLEDLESLDLSDNAMNYQRWLEVEVIERDESNKMELTTLTASWESLNNRLTDELAAALARAEKAEANIVEMNKVIELLQSQRDRTREELKQLRKVVADAGIDDSFWNQSLL